MNAYVYTVLYTYVRTSYVQLTVILYRSMGNYLSQRGEL